MTSAQRWWGRLPPTLLGAGLGVAGMVAAGLLLYGGPGFLPALVVILAVQLAALAAGLLYAHGRAGAGTRTSIRKHWFLVLVAMALAALFSGAWEIWSGFGVTGLSQGVGLALLAAFPLFAGGAVIGSLSRARSPRGGQDFPGAWALLGGAVGVAGLGLFLFPVFRSTTSILLLTLVGVSLAALIQDRLLLAAPWVERGPLSREGRLGAEQGLEKWMGVGGGAEWWTITAGDRIQLLATGEGKPVLEVDHAMASFLSQQHPEGGRALFLGAGRVPLISSLEVSDPRGPSGSTAPRWRGRVLTPWPEELRRLYAELDVPAFQALECEAVEVGQALMGSPAHLPPRSCDLIVLDTLSLSDSPASFRLPPGALYRLQEGLKRGGLLLIGPLQDGGRAGSLITELRYLSPHFARLSLYLTGRTRPDELPAIPEERWQEWRRLQVEPGARTAFLAATREGGRPFPDRIEGFLRVRLTGKEAATVPPALGGGAT